MSKERDEIQEMARDICIIKYGSECEDGCKVRSENGRLCECGQYAEELYKAGYRKANKVRKEVCGEIFKVLFKDNYIQYDLGEFTADNIRKDTAKEVLQDIGNVYQGLDADNEEMYIKDFDWYKDLCEKYDVEVENDNK